MPPRNATRGSATDLLKGKIVDHLRRLPSGGLAAPMRSRSEGSGALSAARRQRRRRNARRTRQSTAIQTATTASTAAMASAAISILLIAHDVEGRSVGPH